MVALPRNSPSPERCESTQSDEGSAEGVSSAEKALSLAGDDSPRRSLWLHDLAVMYLIQYEITNDRDALELSISTAKGLVDATPRKSSVASTMVNLGIMYHHRYGETEDVDDLSEAISWTERGLSFEVEDDPQFGGSLSNLASLLSQRYEQTQDQQELDKAIAMGRRAVRISGNDDFHLAASSSNLARMLCLRYRKDGSADDLHEAISHSRTALQKTSEDRPAWPVVIKVLLDMLPDLAIRTGITQEIDEILYEVSHKTGIEFEPLRDALSGLSSEISDQITAERKTGVRRVRQVDVSDVFVHHGSLFGGAVEPSADDLGASQDISGLILDDFEEVNEEQLKEFQDNRVELVASNILNYYDDAEETPSKVGNLILRQKNPSPDSLTEILSSCPQTARGIQGRSLTLCGCCNVLTGQ